jgi:ubiquinone/menaquinone biosynthesis C-methylase UbiE
MNKIGRSFQEEANLTMERYLNDSYFSPRQWISYCGQINAVRRVSPKTLLEIGVGNGIVYKILEHLGIKVTTYDININLNPTVVGNILDIDNYFEAGSFDCVLCAEVLEHLPFNLFEKCLGKIAYLTRKSSIITLPRAGTNLIYCSGEHPREFLTFCYDFLHRELALNIIGRLITKTIRC